MITSTTERHATSIARFERFFREVASLDTDKSDLARLHEFIDRKLRDLLLRAQAIAKANLRDVIERHDLPITKGLQECMNEYAKHERELRLEPQLDAIAPRPRLDAPLSDEADAALPKVAGGLAVAAARSFKIVDPKLKNPSTADWERSFALFDLLL